MASPRPAWLDGFDLRALPPDFVANPYPYYHALREHDPLRRMPDGSVLLTRYEDCVAVYKDPLSYSSDKHAEFFPKFGPSPLYEHHTTSLVFNDPPLHTRVRRLIIGALTPRAVEAMTPGLEQLVQTLLDRLEDKARTGQPIDLIEDYAAAIPVEIIGNLLAVPREERGPLRAWSLAILGALEPAPTAEQLERGNRAVTDFLAYLRTLVARRRAAPGDPATDVLTRLIVGEGEERLTETELLHNCIFLLNAGHETTTNLIGNALALFCEYRFAREALRATPSLIGHAVEECLRYESSNQLGNRITTREVTLGGVTLPAQTRITLVIGAANRDPAQFPDPDRFDIQREPNRHLAFATGPHLCAGHALARLEGRIAIGRFLERFPRYEIDLAAAERSRRVRFRGWVRLPAKLHASAA
ncbi:MAG: cytochrome P450 [Casimicrobiaceae bacterium]|nr:cytochrome P450 [Casimicrobiaceae bacterium]MDW8312498.1 cytochrome P450 [Burkholderiales bacterium]